MAEKPIPFVVTDRRKFNLDGEPRQEFQDSKEERERHERSEQQEAEQRPAAAPPAPPEVAAAPVEPGLGESDQPPAPTGEQMEQSKRAFDATAERLDTAIRATNPGMERAPEMSFERLVQSVYMTAIMQLGGAAPEGQAPQV